MAAVEMMTAVAAIMAAHMRTGIHPDNSEITLMDSFNVISVHHVELQGKTSKPYL
jgi:hypothetical protein